MKMISSNTNFRTLSFAGIVAAMAFASNAQAVIRFVDPSSPGPTHNGTTWAFAYTSLQTALAAAVSNDEVWVANGTYLPTATTDRTISFVIPSGVKVFGGFAGSGVNETSLAQRDILANRAVLSGNIGAAGSADNSFHVVFFGAVNGVTRLDGVFIIGGNANGGGSDNQGAGLRNSGNPTVRNCVFVGNTAASSGGAVLCTGGVSGFVNCVFSGNTATVGAAVDMQNGRAGLLNCTIANNTNTLNGVSAVRLLNGDGFPNNVDNCIIYSNTAPSGTLQNQQISATNALLDMDNCCVQGLDGSLGGVGNIGGLPRFIDVNGVDNVLGTLDDNYSLRGGSAGIDAGDNALIHSDLDDLDDDGITNEPLPFDIDYQSRKIEDIVNNTGVGTAPIVDMGAYELARPVRIICVNDTAIGTNFGNTWADAYTSLQTALFDASNVKEPPAIIFVAQGTYKPSTPAGRAATFSMVGGTPIYGGFNDSGTQGSLSQRNPHANRTILSGDIGIISNNTDNCFHVVTANGANFFGAVRPTLDGFVVTAGNCNGTGAETSGGGILIFNSTTSDPVVRNCKFVGNTGQVASALDSLDNDVAVVNCAFSGNSCTSFGAVVRLGNISSPTLINCTIANNTPGGVVLVSSVAASFTNCVLVDNGSGTEASQLFLSASTATVNYSCIEGLTGSLGGSGNIGVVPFFADANGADNIFGTPDDDYHLLSCSSVIDAGNFNALPDDTEDLDDDGLTNLEKLQQDIAYAFRFWEDPGVPDTGLGAGRLDIGAFEFQGTSGGTCPADCFPIGAPNGQVNIDDLVTVITQWGVCVSGNCAGDVTPPCKNQVINIDDLVSVITSWGNCP